MRNYREREGISQGELAKRLGMSRNYVSMIEGGKTPSDQVIRHFGLLEDSLDGLPQKSEDAADKLGVVKEPEPHYGSMEKLINIREKGSPEQLALLDAFLETLQQQIQQSGLATVTTDTEGRITEINRAFSEMCGYSLGDLYGKKPGDVLQGPKTEQDVVEEFRAAIRELRPFQCDMANYAKDGTEYRVHIEMFPIFDAAGRHTNFKAIERKL